MKKFLTICVGLVLLCTTTNFTGNNPSFSKDKSSFFSELRDHCNAKVDKAAGQIILKLEGKMNDIDDRSFEQMVKVCNAMSEKNLKPKPFYLDYLNNLNAMESAKMFEWNHLVLKTLDKTKPGQSRAYGKFLKFSLGFFQDKYLRRSKSGISWQIGCTDYQMAWKDDKAVFQFVKSDLRANRKKAQMAIVNAEGHYYPLEEKWVGTHGIVKWERLSKSEGISCEMKEYEIDFSKNEYKSKVAYLTYPKYFKNTKIEGTLHDKLLTNNPGKKGSFPRFTSRSERVNLDKMTKGFKLKGGFVLEGLKMTVSNKESKAELSYELPNTNYSLKLSAKNFAIDAKGKVSSGISEAVIYNGSDSIYHPGIHAKLIPGKSLTLSESKNSTSKAPYYDSYHQIYFYSKSMKLDLKKKVILIDPAKFGDAPVTVESANLFDQNYFNRIQNVSNVQPIILLHLTAKEEGKVIDANYYAKKVNSNFTTTNIKNMLFDLERHGFLTYDSEKEQITITQKVNHYADAHAKRSDFDVLKIKSDAKGTNGVIDLESNETELLGVKNVHLQIRQKVGVMPDGERIVIKKNRDFEFDGKVFAGLTVLKADKCEFDYDNFQVKMDSIHFFDLYLPSDESYEHKDQKSYAIGSRIENTSGTLLVNAPNNKSGNEELDMFPSLSTNAPSYVFYDYENKQGKAYSRDNFYFELAPFNLNNLDRTKASDFNFKGKLYSADIFPEIEETLVYQQDDQSLGFNTKTEAEGLPIFKEKGKFNGAINLSNKGLEGNGRVSYSGTDLESEDLIFTPEGAKGTADQLNIEEDKSNKIPQVKGEDVIMNWKPYQDSMIVTSKDKSFELFKEGNHEIGGVLISTPSGIKGRGNFEWTEGNMKSQLFDFGSFAVESEKTDLKIKSMETEGLAFDTENIKGKIDFSENKGHFESNKKNSITKMPANEYKTTLNEFDWDLGKKSLTFVAEEGKLGTFTSTHKDQDSLTFEGATGSYDFNTSILEIGGVPHIEASDATIFPEKGDIKVELGGKMQEIHNATILANRTNKYHSFTNATVQINAKHNYNASGDYEYKVGDLTQVIHFDKISGAKRGKGKFSEKVSTTQAETSFEESANFKLDPKTFFYGDVNLDASDLFLKFKGFAKMDADLLVKRHWFSVDFGGDKTKMLVAADKPKNPEGYVLQSGIFMNKETGENYTSLLMPLSSKKDLPLFDANGVIQFDTKTKRFVLGNELKLKSQQYKGNLLYFSDVNAKIVAKGAFNICPNIKSVGVQLAGIANTGMKEHHLAKPELANNKLEGKFAAKIDLQLPKKLMKIIQEDFLTAQDSMSEVQYKNQDLYRTVINEWVEKAADHRKATNAINVKNQLRLPEGKNKSDFVLAEMPMQWNEQNQLFISTDEQIALSAIGGESFNKMVSANVAFITPTNEDDRFYIILNSPNKNYYYFNFKKGILHVDSSNPLFIQEIEKMDAKSRKFKGLDKKEIDLQLTTKDLVNNFRRQFETWKSELK